MVAKMILKTVLAVALIVLGVYRAAKCNSGFFWMMAAAALLTSVWNNFDEYVDSRKNNSATSSEKQ